MNEYNFNVNFELGKIDTDLINLVQNDYNSTKLNCVFDKEGKIEFKLLFPDQTAYVSEIENNEVVLSEGMLAQSGKYRIEISLYGDDSKLTNYATHTFTVRNELVNVDDIVEIDDRVPILSQLINDVSGLENTIEEKEEERTTNEQTRQDNEELRITNEAQRIANEITRQEQEEARETYIEELKEDVDNGRFDGENGYTPNVKVGTTSTLEAGSQATVTRTGTLEEPIFNFGIPKGETGPKGDKGDRGDKGDSGLTQQEVQDLIDASIEELGELGFTPTVVQTLPTQDIDTHTIYLVPKQDSEQEDAYDEWLYINNAWEHIGSTSIDLSNYYTKSEIKEINSNRTESIVINIPSVARTTFSTRMSDNTNNLTLFTISDYNSMIQEMIIGLQKAYDNGSHFVTIGFNDGYNRYNLPLDMSGYDIQTKPTYMECSQVIRYGDAFRTYRLMLNITWNGDTIASLSRVRLLKDNMANYLSNTNIAEYIPVGDFNPATKKYVDDSIAAIPSSSYTAGEGINIDANNEISSTMPIYLVENVSYSNPFIIEGKPNGIYYFGHNSNPYITGYSGGQVRGVEICNGFLMITNSTIDKTLNTWQKVGYIWGTNVNSIYKTVLCFSGTLAVLGGTGATQVGQSAGQYVVPVNGNCTINNIKTFNTLPESSVVPTTNNQLVNKKYVDDSITSAIGNINTILATLTTPSNEGGE